MASETANLCTMCGQGVPAWTMHICAVCVDDVIKETEGYQRGYREALEKAAQVVNGWLQNQKHGTDAGVWSDVHILQHILQSLRALADDGGE